MSELAVGLTMWETLTRLAEGEEGTPSDSSNNFRHIDFPTIPLEPGLVADAWVGKTRDWVDGVRSEEYTPCYAGIRIEADFEPDGGICDERAETAYSSRVYKPETPNGEYEITSAFLIHYLAIAETAYRELLVKKEQSGLGIRKPPAIIDVEIKEASR